MRLEQRAAELLEFRKDTVCLGVESIFLLYYPFNGAAWGRRSRFQLPWGEMWDTPRTNHQLIPGLTR